MKLDLESAEPPARRSGEGVQPAAIDPLAGHLLQAARGDLRGMGAVLEAVTPAVLKVTRLILGSQHPDLEDIVQESLVAILNAIERFRGESTFMHYARRIALRTALAARRKAPELGDWFDPDETRDEGSAPDELLRARRIAAFRQLLDELPEPQRESLALRVILGHSLPEVAQATGVPVNTVRSRIRLAKEHLRQSISGRPELSDLFEVDP